MLTIVFDFRDFHFKKDIKSQILWWKEYLETLRIPPLPEIPRQLSFLRKIPKKGDN